MQILEVSIVGVRAAVITFGHPDSPLRFRLFPMAHCGRPAFYTEVVEQIGRTDLIVAEGRDQGSSVGFAHLLAARATRQEGSLGLVHQNIDYAAVGVPVLWPDMPGGNPRPKVRNKHRIAGLSWLDVWIWFPVQLVMMTVGGRRHLLRTFKDINDDTRLRMKMLTETLLHSRDRTLARTLREVHAERVHRPETVAVVYGAAHMPAVVRTLGKLGYRPVHAGWLSVIDVAESPAEGASPNPR